MINQYPKRLIEVDLPIKRISAHARREKSRGTISLLHIWWARRPLVACRAVICAALWIDPADPLCPQVFRDRAMKILFAFAKKAVSDKTLSEHCSKENWAKWSALVKQEAILDSKNANHLNILRFALLDFIADFADWNNSSSEDYLQTSIAITKSSYEALGGEAGCRPIVVDFFAGGGSIPLEALRVGGDAFSSDLNPIPVLLNKVLLEYVPQYGQRLSDQVKLWGEWIKEQLKMELADLYPPDPDGGVPVAYLWGRKIICEGPGCGIEFPLIRNLWLIKKGKKKQALRIIQDMNQKQIHFEILDNPKNGEVGEGTVKRGGAVCPNCGFITTVEHVREQLKSRSGGTTDATLLCIAVSKLEETGKQFRIPNEKDFQACTLAEKVLEVKKSVLDKLIPEELAPPSGALSCRNAIYGMSHWFHFFTKRQLVLLATITKKLQELRERIPGEDLAFRKAIITVLSLALDRECEHSSSLCRWNSSGQKLQAMFGRQSLPMVWDFCEANPIGESVGSWENILSCVIEGLGCASSIKNKGNASQANATKHVLPDDFANAFITDPPYYDSINYANISDFFYVWLKRSVGSFYPELFEMELTDKANECVFNPLRDKNPQNYEIMMEQAMREGRRVLAPSGIGIVVFAHKSTTGWESQLEAMVKGGWIITASWPIDTEMGTRMNAMGTASLASSIHLVCRPRENLDGSVSETDIGDWRDVLQELPKRIHDWMPRLAQEGVVGADAIFACLGPALEIFSRYSHVEKASGETVSLKEYLEHVWAVVAKEALDMVFSGAQTSDFEEDARLTAMWLWTLSTGVEGNGSTEEIEDESTDDEESGSFKKPTGGFVLEFDAVRKIAQGLGAHLEQLQNLIESKGETARLLPVSERARYLFGKEAMEAPKKKKKKSEQTNMFAELGIEEESGTGFDLHASDKIGVTVLDRLHQSMILFATGRSEALKRFIIEDGVGQDQRFWRLAQAFSALYPSSSEEKRWVDGVLARKKGLGF